MNTPSYFFLFSSYTLFSLILSIFFPRILPLLCILILFRHLSLTFYYRSWWQKFKNHSATISSYLTDFPDLTSSWQFPCRIPCQSYLIKIPFYLWVLRNAYEVPKLSSQSTLQNAWADGKVLEQCCCSHLKMLRRMFHWSSIFTSSKICSLLPSESYSVHCKLLASPKTCEHVDAYQSQVARAFFLSPQCHN